MLFLPILAQAQRSSFDFKIITNEVTKKKGVKYTPDNTWVVPEEYDMITPDYPSWNYICWAAYKDGRAILFDQNGNKVFSKSYKAIIPFDFKIEKYSTKTFFICKNETGKYGVLDTKEMVCLDFIFDSISVPSGDADIIALQYQGKWGIKDDHTQKDWLISPTWERMNAQEVYMPIHRVESSVIDKEKDIYILAYQNDKQGLWALKDNKWALQPNYDEIIISKNFYYDKANTEGWHNLFQITIEIAGKQGVAQWNKEKREFDLYLEPKFDQVLVADGFRTSNRFIPAKKQGKWGFWNAKEQTWTAVDCDSLYCFNAVRETTATQLAPAMKDYGWGYVDTKGQWVIEPKWDAVDYFFTNQPRAFVGKLIGEGKDLASLEFSWYWGIIDEKGKEIVPLKYKYLYTNEEGTETLVTATQTVNDDTKWGLLDAISGKVYYPCKYAFIVVDGDVITINKKGLTDKDFKKFEATLKVLGDNQNNSQNEIPEEKNDGNVSSDARPQKAKSNENVYIKRSDLLKNNK